MSHLLPVLRRGLVVAIAALSLALALLVPASAHAAADTTPATPPSWSPAWVPLHTGFGVDCAGHSPGCTAKRQFYSIDIIPVGQFGKDGKPSHALVYAMGAGVVHIGNAHGTSCGYPQGSFGTWLWINHGHGVKSRYGHLSKILVHNGEHVTAGTPIGVVGNTGKAVNCKVNYLDFEIIHGRLINANAYTFSTLQACSMSGQQQTWPAQAVQTKSPGNHSRVHYSIWGHVAHGTQFPASTGSCINP